MKTVSFPGRIFVISFFMAAIGLSVTSVTAQSTLRERLAERLSATAETDAGRAGVELSYGSHDLQKLDFWKAASASAPLVVYVHGGGWKRGDKAGATGLKDEHYLKQGYAFASLNYRLVPSHTVEDQAQDVADALAYLITRAGELGFDGKRVALMGHSAGAHLVALVGTDLTYLKNAGLDGTSLRGILPIDGAAFHVSTQIAEGGEFMRETYEQAFGNDPVRRDALSPTLQAAAPNAPGFLIIHVQRQDAINQSKALAKALREAGTPAEVRGFEGRGLSGHSEINRRLGDPAYPATPIVDEWLEDVLGGE